MHTDAQSALFKDWLSKYSGIIYRIALAYTTTGEDREDLVQDILVQVWNSLPRFEGNAGASTWIYRVALNTALAWQRKDQRRRLHTFQILEIDDIPDEQNQFRESQEQELVENLYAAIHKLPKVDAALVLLYLEDLSYREISQVLGISENHVGVKLNRARKTLAELMKGVACEP